MGFIGARSAGKEVQVRVHPVDGESQDEDPKNGRKLERRHAPAPALNRLKPQAKHRSQEHPRTTGAQRQLAGSQVERAQVDPVADRVPDGICLSQQSAGRVEQPAEKQQDSRGDHQPFPGRVNNAMFELVFHIVKPL